jgi:hypothetical protein
MKIIRRYYWKYFFLLLFSCVFIYSCRQVHKYNGKSIIIKKTIDSSLNDSILVFGKIYSAEDNKTPEIDAKIWVNILNISTYSNDTGYYDLKLSKGIYTIFCKRKYGNDDEIVSIRDIKLSENEEINIDFYIGKTIE